MQKLMSVAFLLMGTARLAKACKCQEKILAQLLKTGRTLRARLCHAITVYVHRVSHPDPLPPSPQQIVNSSQKGPYFTHPFTLFLYSVEAIQESHRHDTQKTLNNCLLIEQVNNTGRGQCLGNFFFKEVQAMALEVLKSTIFAVP